MNKQFPFLYVCASLVCLLTACSDPDKPILQTETYGWYADKVVQQEYKSVALSPTEIVSDYQSRDKQIPEDAALASTDEAKPITRRWQLTNNIEPYPHYHVPFKMENALYNMALDEMVNAIEADSTLRTGKEWAGVWTRDVSYSIILSMAYMQPQVSMNSLMKKVNSNGRIIQDTGTGGAWPCSSDRMVWAIAAWELYKVTGNLEWLQMVYPIIRHSIEDDFLTVYDPKTGLVMAESSFIDWREQSYPRWMEPVDIYLSKCLGTNAVHAEALKVLSQMSELLGMNEDGKRYREKAKEVRDAINNHLWMDDKHYYAQYVYGRNYDVLSPRSETLGEALCILFDIANSGQQRAIVQQMPLVPFGPSIFYPQVADQPPYHTNGVWPFVTSYWMLAAAKTGNEAAVMHAVGSTYRAAALFATNKENFVAETGDYAGTQINSDNMLWSLSGCLAVTHKLLFGIRFETDGLAFEPFVPQRMGANRKLTGFAYRKARLDIQIEGYGSRIRSFLFDGKEQTPFLPATISGKHTIKIVMANNEIPEQPIHLVRNSSAPPMPVAQLDKDCLIWSPIENAASYQVLKNGDVWQTTNQTYVSLPTTGAGEYQVITVDTEGIASFASEPVRWLLPEQTYEVEDYITQATYPYAGYKGNGFSEISKQANRVLSIPVSIAKEGLYAIDWRYANGNGPINTENKCAIRTLFVDDKQRGVSVFPHRGSDEWDNWGWSNAQQVYLKQGKHTIRLEFLPHNENMNIEVNQAMLDQLRLTQIAE